MPIFMILFIETDIWNNVLISDDDFEFNSDNEEAIDTLTMDDDNLSTTTNIGSTISESTIDHDTEISPFTMIEQLFKKSKNHFY